MARLWILVHLILFLCFIVCNNAVVDSPNTFSLNDKHWWIWIHGSDVNKYFIGKVSAKYNSKAHYETITYKKKIHGTENSRKIILKFKARIHGDTEIRVIDEQRQKWAEELAVDGFTRVKEFTTVKVRVKEIDSSGNVIPSSVVTENAKVWIRPFSFDAATPTILFIGKKPQSTVSIHYAIYKWIDLPLQEKIKRNAAITTLTTDDLAYYHHGNTFTYIRKRPTVPTDQIINDWKEFLWSKRASFYGTRPAEIDTFDHDKTNDKIQDAFDLIQHYDANYAPQNIWWNEKNILGSFEIAPRIHSYIEPNENYLEIFNSAHTVPALALKVGQRVQNTNFEYVFIEIDSERAKRLKLLKPSKKTRVDMYAAAQTANDKSVTKQIILADMPFGDTFRGNLLFEPNSRYWNGPDKDHKNAYDEEFGKIGPVANWRFYHYMITTVRNLWMTYALNYYADKVQRKRFFIVIGGDHAATLDTSKVRNKGLYYLHVHSIQKMLTTDHVSLPFTFDTSNPSDPKVKFNFDPSMVLPENAATIYKGESVAIGEPIPGWYDEYRELIKNNEPTEHRPYNEHHNNNNEYHDNNNEYYNIMVQTSLLITLLIIGCGFIFGICAGWGVAIILNFVNKK
eukprot:141936_1